MAFDVTPTSGEVPYVYTSEILNKESFDLGVFRLELKTLTQVGSCSPSGDTGVMNVPGATALRRFDTYTQTTQSVPPGNCRQSNLIVRDLRTGEVVSIMSVAISNV